MALLDKARSLAQQYARKQLLTSAIFWADKALSLSCGDPADLATYASLLHANGQHQRAAHILLSSPLLGQSAALRYLAAKCHVALHEWEEALLVLRPPPDELQGDPDLTDSLKCPEIGDVRSASLLVQAEAHEGLGSLPDAATCYKEALAADVFCEEALERLCSHHCLSAEEEKALLASLPFRRQCSVDEEKMLRLLYQAKMRHHRREDLPSQCSKEPLQLLATNTDVVWSTAHTHFCNMNVDSCYELTKQQLEKDPFHPPSLLLFIACCVEKGRHEELFALGQKLVSHFPSSPLSWYAVSCYYLAIKSHQSARRYLTKTISLDANFAAAHMAFGHSFATEGEHDQAISAFSKAARIMKGSHLPLLQLGREYYTTGSTATAIRFMKSALSLAPADPSLLQEIGVMLANAGNLEKAAKYFCQAILYLQSADPHMTLRYWEPVYNNLGHVYRKQKRYSQALEMHHKALSLCPRAASSLSAVAFVYLLQADCERATEYCSRSLRLRREDHFTLEVLRLASNELVRLPLDLGTESLDMLEPENEILEWEHQGTGNGMKTKGEEMQTD